MPMLAVILEHPASLRRACHPPCSRRVTRPFALATVHRLASTMSIPLMMRPVATSLDDLTLLLRRDGAGMREWWLFSCMFHRAMPSSQICLLV